jgi:phosphopantetheinyl transferase (holo-ACP synthase)
MRTTYRIVRFYQNGSSRVLRRGLTAEEARKHCEDPETSSTTATSAAAKARTKALGHWFDGYTEE